MTKRERDESEQMRERRCDRTREEKKAKGMSEQVRVRVTL